MANAKLKTPLAIFIEGSTPSTPSSWFRNFYAKSDGFYMQDSGGVETKFPTTAFSWLASITGTNGTWVLLTMWSNYAAAWIGQSIVLDNTQTSAQTLLSLNTGTSLFSHRAIDINVSNLSSHSWIKINCTWWNVWWARWIEFTNNWAWIYWLTYMIYQQQVWLIWQPSYWIYQAQISDSWWWNATWWYVWNLWGSGWKFFSLNDVSSTGVWASDYAEILVQHTKWWSSTTNESKNLLNIKRTNICNGFTGTYNVSWSVLRLENVWTQTQWTLNDTVSVLSLNNNRKGGHIIMNANSAFVWQNEWEFAYNGTHLYMRIGSTNYQLDQQAWWWVAMSGATWTGMPMTMSASYAASGIGSSVTIDNTQTNALKWFKADLGSSAIAHAGFSVAGSNASAAANAFEAIMATWYTGDAFHYSINSVDKWRIDKDGNMIIGTNQVVTVRQTWWTAWTWTASRATKATTSATLEDVAQWLKALTDDLITHGLIWA